MPEKQDFHRKKNGPDILLGSGSVDPTILASVIRSFYGNEEPEETNSHDRRRYKGKHQTSGMKNKKPSKNADSRKMDSSKNADSRKMDSSKNDNSPMYIRLNS